MDNNHPRNNLLSALKDEGVVDVKDVQNGYQIRFSKGDFVTYFTSTRKKTWQGKHAVREEHEKNRINSIIDSVFTNTNNFAPVPQKKTDASPVLRKVNSNNMEIDHATIKLYFSGKGNWYAACDETRTINLRSSGSDEIDGLAKVLSQLPHNYSAEICTSSQTLIGIDPKNHPNSTIRKRVKEFFGTRENQPNMIYVQSLCVPKHPREILSRGWYSDSVAILIGINDYPRESFVPKLNYCVADVDLMENYLKRNFRVITLKDSFATKITIQSAILDTANRMDKNGRLLIFFAGHGDQTSRSIIPYDFNPQFPYGTSIPMRNFGHDLPSVVPKHTLLILDCCYSGNVAVRGYNRGQLEDYLDKKAFDALTAGQTGQEALEENGNGVFTRALVEGLEGKAFKPTDEWITSQELGQYVVDALAASSVKQTPQFWRIGLDKEEADGLFIFEHPNSPQ